MCFLFCFSLIKIIYLKEKDPGKCCMSLLEESKEFSKESKELSPLKDDFSESCAVDFKEFPMPEKKMKIINFPIHVSPDPETKKCPACKNESKINHIVALDIKESVRSLGVHQLVIKQAFGEDNIYLFNFHFEIIDYLTKFSLKKRFEKFFKTTIMKEPSVEESKRYSERFMKCMRNVFSTEEIQLS